MSYRIFLCPSHRNWKASGITTSPTSTSSNTLLSSGLNLPRINPTGQYSSSAFACRHGSLAGDRLDLLPQRTDAAISPYRSGEIRLAEHFYQRIPSHSVTLLDKGFWGADLLLRLHNSGEEKHWLIPARQGVVAEVVEDYGPGDRLVVMAVSPQACKKNPALPAQWTARAVTYLCGDKEKTVFTSLPITRFSAQQIAGLYH